MLAVEGLSKFYNGIQVVKDVSFTINEGERLILLGTSGSGKSTVLKMINRLVEKDSGTIKLNGEDLSTFEPHLLRRQIGYVIQHIGLFPHYSVAKNIGLVPSLNNWPLVKTEQRIAQLIKTVGLDSSLSSRMPHELSGGQQQRVGIARALAAEPKLLLMDEPFGALDPITRKDIQKLFLSLDYEQSAIVLVTHDVKEAFLLADKICLLNQGEIQQTGTPKELLFNPANTFVKNFLADHSIELELSLVRIKHLFPFLENHDHHETFKEVGLEDSLSQVLQLNEWIMVSNENQTKAIHSDKLVQVYFNHHDQIRQLL